VAKLDASISVNEYIKKEDWRVSENSNAHYSFGALNKYLSSKISALFWLEDVYNEEIASAHNNGFMHIHDLGSISPYCAGYSLTDIIKKGVRGVSNIPVSSPAKHFMSLLNQVANLTTVFQNELAGAVAFSSFDTLCAPFVKVDGLDYDEVYQHMQNFIFSINSNSRGGAEPAFSNLSFDLTPPKDLLNKKAIVGGEEQSFTYKDCQKEMDMINKAFFEIMIKGDSEGAPFSYPIPTYNIHERFDWNNKNNELLWVMTGKFGTPYFANFINSDMDPSESRSMCPIGANEKVLIKSSRGRGLEFSSIGNIYRGNSTQEKYEIYSNGKFVSGRFNQFKDQKMLRITLANGHTLDMSEEHLNFVMSSKGSVEHVAKGKDLKVGEYLPYSLNVYDGRGGSYELGYFVGAFAGDGSLVGDTSVVFSLSEAKEKAGVLARLKDFAESEFGARTSISEHEGSKLITLRISSKALVGLCKEFVNGKEKEKCYSANVFGMSVPFRKGVIDGHYDTDGGNSYRIYTSSVKMVESLNMLASTLGTVTNVVADQREGRFGTDPNYTVRIYQLTNDYYRDTWFKSDDKVWFKIEKVEEIPSSTAYCFEVEDGEPMFTVGTTGILTHNCRLKIDLRELRRRGGGLFGSGELTGSIGVVTLNLPRLAYLSSKKYDNVESAKKDFFIELEKYMNIAKESLELKRVFLEKQLEAGLFPAFKEYVGHLENHFSTIGLVGMNEMCLNLLGTGIKDDEGKQFSLEVLDFMRDKIADFQEETGNLYNLEATPAESCLAGETKIKTVEYGDEEIKNLVGKEFGVWSYDADNKEVCIKRGHSVRKTQENAKVMELILDNGESLILTPNHPIAVNRPNRWGLPTINWVEARDLKPGDSIKSLYFTQAGENGYVMVNGAQKRANILSEWYEQRPIDSDEVVHHKDFDKTNDSIDNKVVSIREIDTLIDVYNMEVDDTECYFVDDNKGNGILVHNCSYRLAKIDVGEFGEDIITQGNTNGFAPYYTNSCHLPVSEVEDILQVISHQEELQEKFTGGTVVHLYTQNSMSGDMAKHIIRTICENYKVPYVSISPVYSICPDHNFIEGNQPICPHCGKETEQYQRITGYIRQVSKFNPGKKAEFADRHQLIPKL
jgi:ribonucleoside-triphosphate reductase